MDVYSYSQEKVDALIENGYEVKPTHYIKRGFELFKQNPGGFIGYSLIFLLISVVLDAIPVVGFAASIAVQGPLFAGFYIIARRINHSQSHTFSDFFKGFDYFVPLLLTNLIGGILIFLGLLLLILPGVYLAVAYSLASLFVVFGGLDFWPALETCRRLITKQWFNFFILAVLLVLMNLLGAILLGVGLLVSLPVSFCAMYVAYEEIVGTGSGASPRDFQEAEIIEG
ncbi:MAG: hypothetical protein ACK4ND_06140 [Cytophagaceae bacterium]